MEREVILQSGKDAIYLIRQYFHHAPVDEEVFSSIQLNNLYRFSRMHKISALLAASMSAFALDAKWSESYNGALYRSVLFENEREKIRDFFHENNIWYILLKGCVLDHYYPEYGIREFSDNDILFDERYRSELRDFMLSQGFENKHFGTGHDDAYYKKPVYNFEMHVMLFDSSSDSDVYEYFQDSQVKAFQDLDSSECIFSKEDFYIYFIAHAFKHFDRSGTGLRTLVDEYAYLSQEELEWDYVEEELEKIGYLTKERTLRSLVFKIFDTEEELSTEEEEMLEYVLLAGVYGNIKNRVEHGLEKMEGGSTFKNKIKYLWGRVFLKMGSIQASYPLFYRHKLLLPLLPFYRVYKALTSARRRAIREIKAVIQTKK